MLRPADTASGITLDPQFAKTCGQRIDQQQATYQRLAEARQQFQGLQGLQATDQAHQWADYTRFAAGQFSVAAVPV
jgi:hypothetical protein